MLFLPTQHLSPVEFVNLKKSSMGSLVSKPALLGGSSLDVGVFGVWRRVFALLT